MKIFTCIFCVFLLNCIEKKNELKQNDILSIVHENNKTVSNITGNFYVLDERFKKPGKHSLLLTKDDIIEIKQMIISQEINELNDSLKFIKSNN